MLNHTTCLTFPFPSSLFIQSLSSLHTSISDCLKGQQAVVVCHHYQCFHMTAQSHMFCSFLHSQCLSNTLYHQVLVPHNSYTPGGDVCGCWCLCLCVNDAVDRERDRGGEGNRGRGRRGVAGPSFMLNKAMMGDRLGTTSQAETGLLSFVHRGSLCLNNLPSERVECGGRENMFVRCKMCRYVFLCGAEET